MPIFNPGKVHSHTNQNRIYDSIIFRYYCPAIQGTHQQKCVFTYHLKRRSSKDPSGFKHIPVLPRIPIFKDFAISKAKNIPYTRTIHAKNPHTIHQNSRQNIYSKDSQTKIKTRQCALKKQKKDSVRPIKHLTLTPQFPIKQIKDNVRVKISQDQKLPPISPKNKPKTSSFQQKPNKTPCIFHPMYPSGQKSYKKRH